jgi:hypothetical protein
VSTVLIAVEGVLGEHSNVHGFHPIGNGIRIARSMRSEFVIAFSTLQADPATVEFWLRMNGMSQPSFYNELLYRERQWTDVEDDALIAQHAQSLRAAGADLATVISGSPQGILAVTELGFPSLFFVNPAYRWAEYRPDRQRLPRSWQDIDDEMTRQRELKATDPRLNEMEEPA